MLHELSAMKIDLKKKKKRAQETKIFLWLMLLVLTGQCNEFQTSGVLVT